MAGARDESRLRDHILTPSRSRIFACPRERHQMDPVVAVDCQMDPAAMMCRKMDSAVAVGRQMDSAVAAGPLIDSVVAAAGHQMYRAAP